MSKFLKTFLLWLCILSLPVQGMAAVTRLACGALHLDPMVVVAGEAEQVVHEEHHAGHHADDMGEQASPCHEPAQSAAHHGADKCSACAWCCTGLGMLAAVPEWPVMAHAPAVWVATFKPLLPSFLSDGLERPPRSNLA